MKDNVELHAAAFGLAYLIAEGARSGSFETSHKTGTGANVTVTRSPGGQFSSPGGISGEVSDTNDSLAKEATSGFNKLDEPGKAKAVQAVKSAGQHIDSLLASVAKVSRDFSSAVSTQVDNFRKLVDKGPEELGRSLTGFQEEFKDWTKGLEAEPDLKNLTVNTAAFFTFGLLGAGVQIAALGVAPGVAGAAVGILLATSLFDTYQQSLNTLESLKSAKVAEQQKVKAEADLKESQALVKKYQGQIEDLQQKNKSLVETTDAAAQLIEKEKEIIENRQEAIKVQEKIIENREKLIKNQDQIIANQEKIIDATKNHINGFFQKK